jgi:hypothetical protein
MEPMNLEGCDMIIVSLAFGSTILCILLSLAACPAEKEGVEDLEEPFTAGQEEEEQPFTAGQEEPSELENQLLSTLQEEPDGLTTTELLAKYSDRFPYSTKKEIDLFLYKMLKKDLLQKRGEAPPLWSTPV